MRRSALLLASLALAGAWGCATMGGPPRGPATPVIRGHVVVSAATRAKAGAASLADAVVYLEKMPEPDKGTARRAKPSRAVKAVAVSGAAAPVIVTKGDAFLPRVLPVVAGTKVEFRNDDHVYHSAFSVSRTKHFDLGTFAPGKTHTVVFDRPGVVNLFCSLHPKTAGFVVVLPNPTFAQADARGAFALPPLPAGTYTVTAWHPKYGKRKATVTVAAGMGTDVRIAF
jgi:plastocyanin